MKFIKERIEQINNLQEISDNIIMCLYKRNILSNIDIRAQIKKLVTHYKTPKSRRVCLPITTIYNAIYLDKWCSIPLNGELCVHQNLRPSFWDVYRCGALSNQKSMIKFRNGEKQGLDKYDSNEYSISSERQSFGHHFDFELVNSCLISMNKKSNILYIKDIKLIYIFM